MRIRCSQSQLIGGINTVLKAVPSKSSMTILECILFNADENGIKLTANDMELGIETYIEGEVEVAGSVAIEAKTISNLIRSYSDEAFVIDSNEDKELFLNYSVAYEENIEKTSEVFENICKKVSALEDVKEESKLLGINSLNDSSVDFMISAVCDSKNQFKVKRQINKIVKTELDKNNIKIPYPQVEVHNGK